MSESEDFVWTPPADDFIWTPPGSDISVRWKMKGWIPPSEQLEYKKKWRYYRSLSGHRFGDEEVISDERYDLRVAIESRMIERCAKLCEEEGADDSGEECAEIIRKMA